jgi:hypothetical protein
MLKTKAWIKTTKRPCDGIEWRQTKDLLMHKSMRDWCRIKAMAWIKKMKKLLKRYEKLQT